MNRDKLKARRIAPLQQIKPAEDTENCFFEINREPIKV